MAPGVSPPAGCARALGHPFSECPARAPTGHQGTGPHTVTVGCLAVPSCSFGAWRALPCGVRPLDLSGDRPGRPSASGGDGDRSVGREWRGRFRTGEMSQNTL